MFPLSFVNSVVLLGALASPPTADTPPGETLNGRQNQLAVKPPRLEELGMRMDGTLDEAQWKEATLLTGFSQFSPRDDVPAEDSTQVLVWYSATAIHFGIRAYEPHGAPRSALGDRDKIFSDDRIELLLGTFHDGRQAVVLGVNPLGVQMDGTLVENNQARGGGSTGAGSRELPDLSPDFVFQSKGRITSYGYELEFRVPFKSIKYQNADVQTWGFNVVRVVQHSAREDSWAPARRANASFLGQSGTLEGLTNLRSGLVLDVSPEVTQRTTGAPAVVGHTWSYAAERPKVGANIRWGLTNNFTLNGTVNPDFSQIESDEGQLQFDPRQALFFAEKRPFFLDGTEYFATSKNLVYTRRIVQPVAAGKLTGKVNGVSLGVLSAVDGLAGSSDGETHPVYTIARAARDFGAHAKMGLTLTDRTEGSRYNRVASFDARRVFANVYSAQAQYAQSYTKLSPSGPATSAPLWNTVVSRNGKSFKFRYALDAVDERFRTQSGFIGRGGITQGLLDQWYTHYLAPGRFIESITYNPALYYTWRYSAFVRQGEAQDKKFHNRLAVTAAGGWSADATVMSETFGFDPALYAPYRVLIGPGDTAAFTGSPRIGNRDIAFSLNTPQWQHLSASAFYLWGSDENFFEWAPADIVFATLNVDARPTDRLRLGLQYAKQRFVRQTDHTLVGESRIPRLKMEYQIARPLFVRLVGEYVSNSQDALRDDGRTNKPLLVNGALSPAFTDGSFRSDFLVSYRPVPGTVLFAGYGAGYADLRDEPRSFRFPSSLALGGLSRTDDVFYVKASYLYRM
ncbi:MAG TPA: DUF5916 domain-containing protein [Gemmatimonadaceae bacterium]|nr:DUF5916 domain-containing protein [Gemmatimonadaceae bacterium]